MITIFVMTDAVHQPRKFGNKGEKRSFKPDCLKTVQVMSVAGKAMPFAEMIILNLRV